MNSKHCGNCSYIDRSIGEEPCKQCEILEASKWGAKVEFITFKKLNGLTPTIESCTMKLIEELGELLEIIGKGNRASGEPKTDVNICPERIISEAFDVAQSAVTMIYTIADKWGIDVTIQQELHEKKLRERGYMR